MIPIKKSILLILLILISFTYAQAVEYTVNLNNLPKIYIPIKQPQTENIRINVDNLTPVIDQKVHFSATGPIDVTYSWDFEDGSTANGNSIEHSFSVPNSYNVRLIAKRQFQEVMKYEVIVNVRPCEGTYNCLIYQMEELYSRFKSNPLMIVSIVGLIILGLLFVLQSYSAEKTEVHLREKIANLPQEKEQSKLHKRAQTIFETLSPREQKIVEFIAAENGKTTQARIHHNANIPRTSLSRMIKSLTRKKVIELIKIGKINKIKFTSWFLEETNQ